MGSSYFILWGKNLRALLKLHATAAGLAAFLLLPLLWRIQWNTPYSYGWHFKSWEEIAPPVFWPSFVGASIVAYSCIRNFFRPGRKLSAVFREPIESPELYLMWQFGCALIGFSIASFLRLVDIRFMPFAQIMLVMLGAIGWGRLLSGLPRPNLWSAAFCAGFAVLTLTKAAAVDTWIQWNYSGMESKPLWNSYLLVNDYLSGDQNSPRVVWEHNDITADTGSVRAFELLPSYSGRSVLEGLYMQSGINSPFVYYIQSELTQNASTPFPLYYYSRPNPARAAEHLRLFNVSQVIAVSDNIANSLDFSPDYELGIAIPPYKIYRLKGREDSYVEPLRFRPLRIPAQNWEKRQFDWFRESSLRVPVVVASEGSPGEFWKSLQAYGGDPEHIPEVPFPDVEEVQAHAVLSDGKITIDTSKPGHPLWIKVSYHPDWRITEGAGELYLASPAFMLLVPGTSKVVLTFDTKTGIYLWGKVFFAVTIVLLILNIALRKLRRGPPQGSGTPGPISGAGLPAFIRRRLVRFSDHTTQSQNRIGMNAAPLVAFAAVVVICVGAISTRNHRDPTLLYNFASDKFTELSENRSSPLALLPQDSPGELPPSPETVRLYKAFDECVRYGQTSVLDYSVLHKAFFMASWDRWDELQQMLEKFLKDNPENRTYPESLAWLGEASLKKGRQAEAERIFRRALFFWPEGRATERAGLRLAEIIGADPLLETARGLFTSGRYLEAYDFYAALALSKDKKTADESTISLAYCCFYMNRWNEASDLFMRWLGDNFDTPESARIQADYKQCLAIVDQNKEWITGPDAPPISPARKGLIVRLIQRVTGEE